MSKNRKRIFWPVLAILLGQMSVLGVPRGSQAPWSKVEAGSLGDVNPFNGSLNFGIPLFSAGGRGDIEIPLMLRLGKNWRKYLYTYYLTGSGEQHSSRCVLDEEGNAPNLAECIDSDSRNRTGTSPDSARVMIFPNLDNELDPGYGPGFLVGKAIATNSVWCSDPDIPGVTQTGGEYRPSAARFYLSFISPDGSQHELVDQNTMGRFREIQSGYCGQYPPGQDFSRGNKFVSTDGSSMTFISDADIPISYDYVSNANGGEPVSFVSGVLFTSDGSQYRIDAGSISWIKDRNGNKTTFSYYNTSSVPAGKLHTITDSIGRTVTIEYDVQDVAPYGLCDRVTYKGSGGQDRVLRISKANLSNSLRTGYSLQTKYDMFPTTCGLATIPSVYCGTSTPFDATVTSSLWLPDGRSYKFQYNSFVEVARVELPTGGAVEFDHDYGVQKETNCDSFPFSRKVTEKRIYSDLSQASLQSKTKYSRIINITYPDAATNRTVATVDATDPNDNLLQRKVSYFYDDPKFDRPQTRPDSPYGLLAWKAGREYQTDVFASDGITLLRRVQNTWQNKTVPWISDQSAAPSLDTTLAETTTTLADTNLVLKTAFTYDSFSNLTDKYEYDFGAGAPGPFVRRTHTDYVTAANYTDAAAGAHLRSLPSQTSVYDASGVERARTTFEYDNYVADGNHAGLLDRPGISGFDSAFTTGYATRGNATATTRYLIVNGTVTGSISAFAQYDIAGNVVKAIDARGSTTTFDFSDRFGAPDGEARSNSAP